MDAPLPPSAPSGKGKEPPAEFLFRSDLDPLRTRILKTYRQLESSQWWSPETLRRRQFAQLGRLVDFARKHVPYYASVLACFPSGSDGIEESAWRSLPILTKQQIQGEPESLHSRYLPPGVRTSAQWTTGSTGRPLEVLTTSGFWTLFWADRLRLLRWFRQDPRGKTCEIRFPTRKPFGHRGERDPILRMSGWEFPFAKLLDTGEILEISIFTTIAEQIRLLEEQSPDYLLTYPSNLGLLLQALRKAGKRLPSLRLVRTMSENLDPELRVQCREILGVPIFDTYGAMECGYIAVQCPDHEHYHVHSELNLVEVLADDGSPCRPGEIGRVVATPLHAFAMPLLRYDLGDYAEVGEPCPCGRGLPVLRRITGRYKQVLTLPSGEKRYSFHGYRGFTSVPAIVQFQVVQKTLTDLEVRLVVERPLEEKEIAEIVAGVTEQVGPGFRIRLIFVDEIPRLPSGKYFDFVSEIDG